MNSFTNRQYHGAYLGYMDDNDSMKQLPACVLEPHVEIEDWLKKTKPDIVIDTIDILSLLSSEGVRVPEDLSFAAIDRKSVDSGIAGFSSNLNGVGAMAVMTVSGMLYYNICGFPECPQSVLINGTWANGSSAPRQIEMVL